MSTVRTALGATRTAVGLSAWLAPDHAVKAFGIDPERSDRFVSRLFASRELALAAALLAAPRHLVGPIALSGAAIDAADAVAGFDEARRGNLSRWAVVSGACGALLFTAMGLAVAREPGAG